MLRTDLQATGEREAAESLLSEPDVRRATPKPPAAGRPALDSGTGPWASQG